MPIPVTCPNPECAQTIAVDDAYIGQQVSCPLCRHVLIADAAGQATPVAPPTGSTPPSGPAPSFGPGPADAGGPPPTPGEGPLPERKGLGTGAVVAIVVGCVLLGILLIGGLAVAVMRPALTRSRQAARQTVCATNLRSVGLAIALYASDHNGLYPDASGSTDRVFQPVGSFAGRPPGTHESSCSADLALLVSGGTCSSPQVFICPSSSDAQGPVGSDFPSPQSLSYGLRWGHDPVGGPNDINLDPRMPVMADKNPYVADPSLVPDPMTCSPNHSDAGQNILFADGHVEWAVSPDLTMTGAPTIMIQSPGDPLAGIEEDNVYTFGPSRSSGPAGKAPRTGQPIHLASKTDVCIVP